MRTTRLHPRRRARTLARGRRSARALARGRRALASTAVATAALLAIGPAGTAAGEGLRPGAVVDPARAAVLHARERWSQAEGDYERLGLPPDPQHLAADAASVLTWRVAVEGWSGPDVPSLVAALLASANPDGGYGLSQPWDAYQDGTVNPSSTSYAATTAGHVGPVLLAGYQAGVVPARAVRRAIDWVLDLPRSHDGRCIPYSNAEFDLDQPCVWNVHFGAAAWVLRASRLTGYRTNDARRLALVARSWLDVIPQDPATGYWPYSSAGGGPQDIGHQLWTASAVDTLLGTRDAMTLMLGRPLWRWQARRFHDSGVASVMAGIALYDCRYATDPTVVAYARSTERGTPYLFKAMAAQVRAVLHACFEPGTATAAAATGRPVPASRPPVPLPAELG